MAPPDYRNSWTYPPSATPGHPGEQHYHNNPTSQSFGPPTAWVPQISAASSAPPALEGNRYERSLPQANPHFPAYESGPAPPQDRQNLHIVTDLRHSGHDDTWSQRSSSTPWAQSPSPYLASPSPNPHGIQSGPRCKLVDIAFEGRAFVQIDLTACSDARAVRETIIRRFVGAGAPVYNFDIFRTAPPGSEGAVNDRGLMIDVEHFGDTRGTLKFTVWPTNTSNTPVSTVPSLTVFPQPQHFPSINPSPSTPRASVVIDYGHDDPVYDARGYGPPRSYPVTPSDHVPMPMPMPTPGPVPAPTQDAYGYPHRQSTNFVSTSPFATPSPSAHQFVGPSFHINPARSSLRPTQSLSGRAGPPRRLRASPSSPSLQGTRNIDQAGGWDAARNGGPRPGSVVICATMATEEVLSHLYDRGCRNVANELNESKISRNPVESGGGGDVYSGELYNGEHVALKCLRLNNGNIDGHKLKKTAHELYVWSKCNHPNVLELIGVTQYRDQIAMVSPWMDNGDLHKYLRLYPDADRHNLCVQIVDGVAYLHSQNIVHGDIKGPNVLISHDGVAKITDFGTSALKEYTLAFATTSTRPGMSIRWTAPEILEERSENSYHADVYSLGMTILEAITGQVPYIQVTVDAVVIRHIIGRRLPVRPEVHIPRNEYKAELLWSLLTQCWSYDYWTRPTAAKMQHEIRNIF